MRIRESVEQILASQSILGDLFYEEFFRRSAEAAQHFDGVDMKRQALVLTMAIPVIAHHFTDPAGATNHYLKMMGSHHRDRSIPAHLYSIWCEAMLVTLAKILGDDWSDALAVEWSDALQLAAATMIDGYDDRVSI